MIEREGPRQRVQRRAALPAGARGGRFEHAMHVVAGDGVAADANLRAQLIGPKASAA